MRALIYISPLIGLLIAGGLFGLAYLLLVDPEVAKNAQAVRVDASLLLIGGFVTAGLGVVGGFMASDECRKHGS
jgi:hypothetical protein